MLALRNRKDIGFTMIELVMVIVIIGILAAAALPRFANLGTSAQIASNQGTAGALRAAVGIAHAAWIAAGASATASTTVTLESQGISVNGNGWPDGGANSNTVATDAGCNTVFSTLLNNPPSSNATTATVTTVYLATATGATCTFALYAGTTAVSPARTITYNITNGTIGIT